MNQKTGGQRWTRSAALAFALILGVAGNASAACTVTFCGNTANDPNSVQYWLARTHNDLQPYENDINPPQGPLSMFQRSCFWCHGAFNFDYTRTAFNVQILEEWMRSSYYMPGLSKAYASWYRINNGTMPPGFIPNTISPVMQGLRDALINWYDQCLGASSTDAGNATIWGSRVVFSSGLNEHYCDWGPTAH